MLQIPYYNKAVNCIHAGLFSGIMDVTVILLVTQVTIDKQADASAYKDFMTNVSWWATSFVCCAGNSRVWWQLLS